MSLRISDTQHDNNMPCSDGRYAECHVLFTIMLSVIMLNVVMLSVIMLNIVILSVIMLNVVMLCVVAPFLRLFKGGPILSVVFKTGKPCYRGWLSTVDLHVLTCLDQLLLILQTLFTFLQNKLPF
jgi:hypothetical protein